MVKPKLLSSSLSSYILIINVQRELRAAYGLIDCLLNGLQPTEKTALFGDLVSIIPLSYLFPILSCPCLILSYLIMPLSYLIISYHALVLSFPVLSFPWLIFSYLIMLLCDSRLGQWMCWSVLRAAPLLPSLRFHFHLLFP